MARLFFFILLIFSFLLIPFSNAYSYPERIGFEFIHDNKINYSEQIPEVSYLKNLNPDVIVVASYGKIIPEYILNSSKYGAINLHPSLLPKYRGPSPVQTAIINDEKISGTSIILLNKTIDGGPIICQEKY